MHWVHPPPDAHRWHLHQKNSISSKHRAPRLEANELFFSFAYFSYPMFNCRRWCFCSRITRMAVLNSPFFHFWRCLCMQLFDDDCLWILNRQREERSGKTKQHDHKQLKLTYLLIDFFSPHPHSSDSCALCTWTKKKLHITGCDFLSFISSTRSCDVCCLLM